jgi:hypothetical protein
MSFAKLEGVDRDSGSEQMDAKVKLMDFSSSVTETHRLELGVFESCQPSRFRYLLVETLATEMFISAFNGAVVDDVVTRGDLGTTITASLREFASNEIRRSYSVSSANC